MPDKAAGEHTRKRASRMFRNGVTAAIFAFFAVNLGSAAGRAGDIELGRYLASECTTCHGAAKADSTIPNIHGLAETHFVEVIKAYRAKALPNPVMQNIAGRLRDEEIAALAAYFATARKPQ